MWINKDDFVLAGHALMAKSHLASWPRGPLKVQRRQMRAGIGNTKSCLTTQKEQQTLR